jgi:capsular polysaccharide biosynthesis protein
MVLPDLVPIEASSHTYQELGKAFHAPPKPPCFTFGTLPGFLAPDIYGETGVGGVGCYRLHDAQVIFDGIILQKNAALWSLSLNHPRAHVQAILSSQAAGWASLPVRHIEGQVAIIHGPGFDIFGHWLVDFLPRLFALDRAGIDIQKIRLILPASTPPFVRHFLYLIGVTDENLVWHDQRAERIAPDELVVPSLFRLRSRFHPLVEQATRFWLDRFATNIALPDAVSAGRKLFISRARLPGPRRMRDRAGIEARAVQAGYKLVCPETLPLSQQIRMFRSASHILGEYGSGLHGSIFSQPGAIVCALRGTSHHPGFAQSGLAERFGQEIGYVFGATPEHAGDTEFSIETAAFEHALSAMEAFASITPMLEV